MVQEFERYTSSGSVMKELLEVMDSTNTSCYALYVVYKTGKFSSLKKPTDDCIGELLGWSSTKVQTNRLKLEKAGLIKFLTLRGKLSMQVLLVGSNQVRSYTNAQ